MTRPSPASLPLSPLLTVLVVGLTALAVIRVRRARPAGVSRRRVAAAAGGVTLVAAVCLSPLETLGAHWLLSAHLAQVIVLMGFAPPLLLLGLPGGSASASMPRWLRVAGRVAAHPALAIVLVNAVFFAWHVPAVYAACLQNQALYDLQLVCLLGVSALFWWPIVEPRGRGHGMPSFVKLGYILLATIPQTFGGLTVALAHRVLYPGYTGLGSMTTLTDQQVAGACLALLTKVALLIAFGVVLGGMLNEGEIDDQTSDGGNGPGDDDDAPTPVRPSAPAWLRLLNRGRVVDEPAVPADAPGRRERERERVTH